jgi:CheY-like chemotaxis protein
MRDMRARILIVEPEDEARAAMSKALRDDGFVVDEATAANDATEIARYAPPDVIVFAMTWGSGLRSLEALRTEIESTRGASPAVVLLVPAWMPFKRGVTLQHPIRPYELPEAVRLALSEARDREIHLRVVGR